MAVIEDITPEERAAFRKSVEPVLAKNRKIIGEDFFELFFGLAKKYEQKQKK